MNNANYYKIIAMIKYKTFTIDGVTYPLKIVYKRKMNFSYKYNGKELLAYVPYFALISTIYEHLEECGPKLIKKYTERYSNAHRHNTPSGHIYLYGDDSEYTLVEDLYHKEYYYFRDILKDRVEIYKKIMNIDTPYKVRLSSKPLKTRFASNSKRTKSITFSIELIHYDIDIIDAIVVHELAHDKHFDHGEKFYDLVYQTYPMYDIYNKCLKKGIHRYE